MDVAPDRVCERHIGPHGVFEVGIVQCLFGGETSLERERNVDIFLWIIRLIISPSSEHIFNFRIVQCMFGGETSLERAIILYPFMDNLYIELENYSPQNHFT